MSHSVIKLPRVERDLAEYFAHTEQDKVELADRLLRVAAEVFQMLADSPDIGLEWTSKHRSLRGVYHYPLPSPYRSQIVFYRVHPDAIEIITVQHGAQNLERLLRHIVD